MRAAGVVAADALLAGAANVEGGIEEVRVRACGRVDDGPAAVDELELLVAPVRHLGALVLAVPDGDGILAERLLRIGGVEEDLDHLPVAFVQVVPVVVGVEEPVLQRQLPGVRGVGGDVRVHSRLVALAQASVPALVAAARVERVPGEVQVILVKAGQVVGLRPALTRSTAFHGPRSATVGSSKSRSTSVGQFRLAMPTLLQLLDDPDDRRMALRERRLVGEVGGGDRTAGKREDRRHDQEPEAHAAGLERKISRPSRLETNLAASCPLTLFPGLVETRRERSQPAFARSDGDDPAADAALPGEADVVQPVAGGLVEPCGRHHRERVAASVRVDHALARDRVHPAVGERGPHHGQVTSGDVQARLPRVDICGLRGVALDPAVALEQAGDALVARVGLGRRAVRLVVERELAAGEPGEAVPNGLPLRVGVRAGHETRGRDRTRIDHRVRATVGASSIADSELNARPVLLTPSRRRASSGPRV